MTYSTPRSRAGGEDMIGGQMFFSLLVLDSLHRLGVHLSEEGAAAYFYAWRVVGAMPGVDQDAVPGPCRRRASSWTST
jgi:hypothetical protein